MFTAFNAGIKDVDLLVSIFLLVGALASSLLINKKKQFLSLKRVNSSDKREGLVQCSEPNNNDLVRIYAYQRDGL